MLVFSSRSIVDAGSISYLSRPFPRATTGRLLRPMEASLVAVYRGCVRAPCSLTLTAAPSLCLHTIFNIEHVRSPQASSYRFGWRGLTLGRRGQCPFRRRRLRGSNPALKPRCCRWHVVKAMGIGLVPSMMLWPTAMKTLKHARGPMDVAPFASETSRPPLGAKIRV